MMAAWGVWDTVRAPGQWVNYAQVAWSLFLVAWPVRQSVRSTVRMTGLIVISGSQAGVVFCIGNAVQAPGDWVNYLLAAWQFLVFLVLLGLVAPHTTGPRRRA